MAGVRGAERRLTKGEAWRLGLPVPGRDPLRAPPDARDRKNKEKELPLGPPGSSWFVSSFQEKPGARLEPGGPRAAKKRITLCYRWRNPTSQADPRSPSGSSAACPA